MGLQKVIERRNRMTKTLKKLDYRVKAIIRVKKNLFKLNKRNILLDVAEKA